MRSRPTTVNNTEKHFDETVPQLEERGLLGGTGNPKLTNGAIFTYAFALGYANASVLSLRRFANCFFVMRPTFPMVLARHPHHLNRSQKEDRLRELRAGLLARTIGDRRHTVSKRIIPNPFAPASAFTRVYYSPTRRAVESW